MANDRPYTIIGDAIPTEKSPLPVEDTTVEEKDEEKHEDEKE